MVYYWSTFEKIRCKSTHKCKAIVYGMRRVFEDKFANTSEEPNISLLKIKLENTGENQKLVISYQVYD